MRKRNILPILRFSYLPFRQARRNREGRRSFSSVASYIFHLKYFIAFSCDIQRLREASLYCYVFSSSTNYRLHQKSIINASDCRDESRAFNFFLECYLVEYTFLIPTNASERFGEIAFGPFYEHWLSRSVTEPRCHNNNTHNIRYIICFHLRRTIFHVFRFHFFVWRFSAGGCRTRYLAYDCSCYALPLQNGLFNMIYVQPVFSAWADAKFASVNFSWESSNKCYIK